MNALSDPDWPTASLNGAVSLLQSHGVGADVLAVLSRNGTSQQVFGHDQLVPAKLQTLDYVYGAVEPTPEEPLAICAVASLAGPMRVNVNTASQETLRAVLDPVARGAADRAVALRRQRPFASVTDVGARLGWSDKTLEKASPLVCVTSSWFALQAEAVGDRSYARVFALLHRDGDRVQVMSWRRIR